MQEKLQRKIKICMVVNAFANGGAEQVLINYLKFENLENYDFSIIGFGESNRICVENFQNIGVRVHQFPDKKQERFRCLKMMHKLFENEKYDIVHSNMSDWNFLPNFVAWLAGIKVRISHSHMAVKDRKLGSKIFFSAEKNLGKLFSTHYWACGELAGVDLFGKHAVESGKVFILPNRIEYDKFSFSQESRDKIRNDLGLGDGICLGHVSRLDTYSKNTLFVVDVFDKYCKNHNDARLLFVGGGPEQPTLKSYIEKKGLESKVIFIPSCNNIEEYYSAMDVLIMPSRYEGFSLVMVEAQSEGLIVMASDTTSPEVKISDYYYRLPIDSEVPWVDFLESKDLKNYPRNNTSINEFYNLTIHSGEMINKYMELLKNT